MSTTQPTHSETQSPWRFELRHRLALTHKLPQQDGTEQIVVEGDNYQTLLAEALSMIPEGRIAAHIRVER